MSTCHRRKAGRKRCWVGTMSLATSCDITRHHATSCDRERKGVGSGWRKMSFDRRRCGRETRWREWERKWKRKAGGSRKHKGFPLHHPHPLPRSKSETEGAVSFRQPTPSPPSLETQDGGARLLSTIHDPPPIPLPRSKSETEGPLSRTKFVS